MIAARNNHGGLQPLGDMRQFRIVGAGGCIKKSRGDHVRVVPCYFPAASNASQPEWLQKTDPGQRDLKKGHS